ncbi:hypothetical protein [Paraconexibacter algicola]|uniref:Fibronectin type-III domain-containing protein n=1 Tax=Paraconexibacter algicola TaxID=2133960 RepID=A0A2T4UDG1_9ACTN|nr:hypothetical protein [Paraconexibacter algicola]PTL55538.1 hypothetical protein C7Y72_17990 [Paraconexibacter algicola]
MTPTRPLLPLATIAASAAAVAVVAAPASALAAKPSVSTSAPTRVESASARLNAKVDPNGATTTYNFQYGPTRKLGTSTPVAPAGSGTRAITARADIAGLKANTTYYYRVIASNASGVVSGGTRSFRTKKVPLSLSLTATPNPVTIGAPTTLTGQLAGTGGGDRRIQLQINAFPYTSGFANAGNSVVTKPDGSFSIPVLGLTSNAQFRVVATEPKRLVSAPIIVGVSPVVRTAVSTTRPRRGSRVRFAGTVSPSWVPAQMAVQKRNSEGRWVTVGGGITRTLREDASRYAVRVTVPRGGTYRVFVGLADSRYAPAVGPEIRLHTR